MRRKRVPAIDQPREPLGVSVAVTTNYGNGRSSTTRFDHRGARAIVKLLAPFCGPEDLTGLSRLIDDELAARGSG